MISLNYSYLRRGDKIGVYVCTKGKHDDGPYFVSLELDVQPTQKVKQFLCTDQPRDDVFMLRMSPYLGNHLEELVSAKVNERPVELHCCPMTTERERRLLTIYPELN
ncbi:MULTISPECIES: hypothetical protein [Kordiimonas]|jgi:hypothetical protein|uniref:Uncharacterized protein n=1 Tax=Kordiimonas lacus TaxID=637679 RepID=A0A1G7BZC2_9PROT|nr:MULTISPECIES: hypothetical protein [Kordiimonas]SDE32373.1 hypothetical protein SAMN04488071_2595 [Kordiimonas lacus]